MAAMQFWKPHSLAKPHEDQLDLRIGDKVRAIVDLPGVAEGTEGKVILANGFNWQRYRVRFDATAPSSATSTSATSSRSAGPPAPRQGRQARRPMPAEAPRSGSESRSRLVLEP